MSYTSCPAHGKEMSPGDSGGCPVSMGKAPSHHDVTPHTYHSYLQLDKVLSSQTMQSGKNAKAVHDEHLFIITHQAYELWFKQVLHEIDSVREMFMLPVLNEAKTLTILNRLHRVVLILRLMVDQIAILETMTPLDFLEFRLQLSSSSGFQSLQFRLLENKLGLRDASRVKYNQEHYAKCFTETDQVNQLEDSINQPSLFDLVEKWLERTPGLSIECFDFWELYKESVDRWLKSLTLDSAQDLTDEKEKENLVAEYKKQKDSFDSILDEKKYNAAIARGDRRFSFEAFKGALLVSLYSDQPRFNQPSKLLQVLMDIDSLVTKWRYNHVMMVQRMIGSKIGTGGSSGYQYLRSTVSDRYKVFNDLFNLATYLIPRHYIPPLSRNMKRELSVLLHDFMPRDAPEYDQRDAPEWDQEREDEEDQSPSGPVKFIM